MDLWGSVGMDRDVAGGTDRYCVVQDIDEVAYEIGRETYHTIRRADRLCLAE